MPGLTPERVEFLNKQFQKQNIYSHWYLCIQADLKTETPVDARISYELVRKTRLDSNRIVDQEFPAFNADATMNEHTSGWIQQEHENLKGFNTLGLKRYYQTLKDQIETEIKAATFALHVSELGIEPTLSNGQRLNIQVGCIALTIASVVLAIFSPFTLLLLPVALVGLIFGPEIINSMMYNRFKKKSEKMPLDEQIQQDLIYLTMKHYIKKDIHPITTPFDSLPLANVDNIDAPTRPELRISSLIKPYIPAALEDVQRVNKALEHLLDPKSSVTSPLYTAAPTTAKAE